MSSAGFCIGSVDMEIWLALSITLVSVVIGGILTWVISKIHEISLLHKLKDAVIDRERVSINEEFLMTQMLAEKIQKDEYEPDIIFAVCPGGAMIAEWLSRRFMGKRPTPIPVKLLYMVRDQENEGRTKDIAKVDDNLSVIPPHLSSDLKVLLVNDISRSGFTLNGAKEFLKKHFSSIQSATLICYQDAAVKPEYYAAVTRKTIRFDWKSYEQ